MTTIRVTVAYALPDAATLIEVRLPAGSTVAQAIERSGIALRHPDVDFSSLPVGVFGSRVERTATLVDGDRIEFYRPLVADAKEARRRRAARRRR